MMRIHFVLNADSPQSSIPHLQDQALTCPCWRTALHRYARTEGYNCLTTGTLVKLYAGQ